MSAPTARCALCVVSLWALVSVTGCQATPPVAPHRPASPEDAIGKVVLGQSTRSDVFDRLGAAIVIPFDSGYEVWVYRWPGDDTTARSASELVVLFDRSGIVTKARVRPGDPACRQRPQCP